MEVADLFLCVSCDSLATKYKQNIEKSLFLFVFIHFLSHHNQRCSKLRVAALTLIRKIFPVVTFWVFVYNWT